MPSRVVRGSLLESDRWLNLAHPAERLAYVVLLLKADDLATADATNGQLVRLWREPCNLKGPEDALRILMALADADLVRLYEADGKRFVFIPRFRQRFRANTFRRPPPPEHLLGDEPDVLENIRQIKAGLGKMADNGPTDAGHSADSCRTSAPVVEVVGEGVVEGEGATTSAVRGEPRPAGAPRAAHQDIMPSATGWIGITEDDRRLWASAYPAVNIESELSAALAWLQANPKNRKSNHRRFVTNWLKRAQDRAPRTGAPSTTTPKDRYVKA